jgi:hypothetical protein
VVHYDVHPQRNGVVFQAADGPQAHQKVAAAQGVAVHVARTHHAIQVHHNGLTVMVKKATKLEL